MLNFQICRNWLLIVDDHSAALCALDVSSKMGETVDIVTTVVIIWIRWRTVAVVEIGTRMRIVRGAEAHWFSRRGMDLVAEKVIPRRISVIHQAIRIDVERIVASTRC
jgi:hypothetical protein